MGKNFSIKLTASIKNLGNVPRGNIVLGGLTLFCGWNGSGKTYAAKALYSALRAVNSNHAWNLIGHEIEALHRLLPSEVRRSSDPLRREIAELATMPRHVLHFLERDGVRYAERVRAIAAAPDFSAEATCNGSAKKSGNGATAARKTAPGSKHEEIQRSVRAIKVFAGLPKEKVFQKSVERSLPDLLLGSFVTPRLSELAAGKQKEFSLDIKGALGFAATGSRCKVAVKNAAKISGMPSVIYLDGMEAQVSGSMAKAFSMSMSQNGLAECFPSYYRDLSNMLDFPRNAQGDFQEELEQIGDIIGGKLEYDGGLLYFRKKKGRRIHASLASAGVRQLGILGLLVERGLLQENSTLFIDEPEANLHPAWQSALTEILRRLVLKGINIVLATHSTFTLQYLKYSVRDSDAFNRMVAVNYCTKNKSFNDELSEFDNNYGRIDFIQDSLNEVYMRILFGEMMRAAGGGRKQNRGGYP